MDLSLPQLQLQPTLVWRPHPLNSEGQELTWVNFLPDENIQAFLERSGFLQRMGRQPFSLTINGRRVPREMWKHCRPNPGVLIDLYAVVGFGGGSKNPVATIAMIALIVA